MRRLGWGFALLAACSPGPETRSRDLDMVSTDKEVEARVVYLLLHDADCPELRERNISVDCVKGDVILKGTVTTRRERERALILANASGVRRVIDRLTVTGN